MNLYFIGRYSGYWPYKLFPFIKENFRPGELDGINKTNNLNDLLNIDDENLYKLNQGQETTIIINENIVTKLFKNFKYKTE